MNVQEVRKMAKELPNDELKEALKVGIENNYTKLGDVISGAQEAAAFASLVAEKISRE